MACSSRTGRPPGPARTTAATLPPPAPAADATLATLRARETTTPLKDFRVRAADGAIELHVEATSAPEVTTKRVRDGVLSTVKFSMGSDIEVTCHASKTPIDLGHWVAAIIETLHATLRTPPAVEVEVHEGHPLFLVGTDATLVQDGTRKAHFAKFAGTHLEEGSVMCVHDGLGYEKTFHEVAAHIAARSVSPRAEPPAFRSVAVARDGDRVIGFEETRAWSGKKAGESRQQTLMSAIPSDDTGWVAADGAWVGVVDARGVVSERTMRRIGKRTQVDMSLQRKSPGVYAYEGTLRGAATKGTFRTNDPMVTRLSRAPSLAAFMRNERRGLSFTYFDEDDPSHAKKQLVRREGASQVRLEEPARQIHCVVDDQGLCTRTWRDGADWSTERVFAAGRL